MKEISEQDFLLTFDKKTMEELKKEIAELRKMKLDTKMEEIKQELLTKINDVRNELVGEINKINKEMVENYNELMKAINEVQEYANGLQRQLSELPR